MKMKLMLMAASTLAALCMASAPADSQSVPERSSPQRNLPYAAVHNPQFIAPSEATFLHAEDRVIGVVSGTVAKAYPAAILSQHGLVEDESPSGPIAIT